ncbi:MAG: anaerobic ribonucleoside-triphosphate reductase activating protein [Peptococcaceae bacterium]|nr:anaerobic ribonucleoside-triphosphate reductase activating protein [Peptococcaceae bacterium]
MGVIRIAGVSGESVVDGPGLRFVVFAQGCPHRCRGCHNPETWDPAGGREVTVGELLDQIRSNPLLRGVTLSGGDPFMQAVPLAELARGVKEMGKDVITYTGYTWEQILEMAERDEGVKSLILQTDILVDGPYIHDQRDLNLVFRGSANQRVIDVRASLEAKVPVLVEWE